MDEINGIEADQLALFLSLITAVESPVNTVLLPTIIVLLILKV